MKLPKGILRHFVVLARSYPLRIGLSVILVAGIWISAAILYRGLGEHEESLIISLLDHSEGRPTTAQVSIILGESGEDELEIWLYASGSDGDSSNVAIALPSSIQRKASEATAVGGRYSSTYQSHDKARRYWVFETEGRMWIREVFRGSILAGIGPESRVELSFDYLAKHPIPTELTVTNLASISFLHLQPQPKFRTEYAIKYTPEELRRSDDTVRMVMHDRSKQRRHDLKVVTYGVGFGICASMLATLLLSAVTAIERRLSGRGDR
ncbi:MAG: hypothetical protein R3E97_22715 [Candidatus Eisenbacteria bacterium]